MLQTILVDEMPDYKVFDYARVGSFSLSTRDRRFIRKEDAVEYNQHVDSVSGHFREYLKRVERGRKNAPHNITYPYFAVPVHYPLCRYYDIRRAYHQIASAYGGEVFVKEGKSVYYGDTTFNNPLFYEQRLARGLLVSGTGEKTTIDIWSENTLHSQSFANSLHSPHLRASINYTLHAILNQLRRWIVYAMTDGFIVPSVYWDRVEAWLSIRNIDYSIKHEGETWIKTRGTYKIGAHQTATYNMWPNRSVDYIIDDRPLWWLRSFQRGKELHS